GNVFVNGVQTPALSILKPIQYEIISIVASGNLVAQYITNDRNLGYFWDGDYAEIIIYNQPLGETQRTQVEQYLRYKYAPPVNLGPDIIVAYGFDTLLVSTQNNYSHYLWSTGDTIRQISISENGCYSVTVTDLFGYQSSDTICVNYPAPNLPDSVIVCSYDSMLITSELDSGYTIQWSNLTTNDSAWVSEPGWTLIAVTDSSGITKYDSTYVFVDSFDLLAKLGNDTSLCAGNSITLASGSQLVSSYLWSDGSSDSSLNVDTTGTYSIILSDENGCLSLDSIVVNIVGVAPLTGFIMTSVCADDTISFIDTSSAELPSSIVQWKWHFSDGDSSNLQNPTHKFPSNGIYSISLIATTDSGCTGTAFFSDTLFADPIPDFSFNSQCVGLPIGFTDLSMAQSGDSLTNWSWNFGNGNTSDSQNPSNLFTSGNDYVVTLSVTTEHACTNSSSKVVALPDQNPTPSIPHPFFPINFLPVDTGTTFSWTPADYASTYKLSVAQDDNFSTIIKQVTGISSSSTHVSGLPQGDTLFWNITIYSACGDSVTSEAASFFTFAPNIISGNILSFSSDYGAIVTDTLVELWTDRSGMNNNAFQTISAKKPRFIDSVQEINHKPVIRFDGIEDFMEFNEINDIRTVFFVVKHRTGNQSAPLLGHNISYDFHNTGTYLFGALTSSNITSGSVFVNGILTPALDILKPTQYEIISIVASGNLVAQYITNDRNLGYFWDGDYAEIIIYNQPLDETQRTQVEQYLRYKYAPPVNLGPDIKIEYGFCDTLVDAGDRFTSFLWSTGETTQTIDVNQGGKYWVDVTDIFGFPSSDTIIIIKPSMEIADTSVCLGDVAEFNTGLDASIYEFLWSDSSTDSVLFATVEQDYSLLITDSNLCTISKTVHLTVDSFAVTAGFSNDSIGFCSGDTLRID
ncbi:MAG: hypothetical protein KKA07_13415, partial [Bacteroidetes bacterium]|nr:hypothetical protein [Bacteroidota bacterium]